MDIIIRHNKNKDNYRVGKDLKINIEGKTQLVTPYASLSKSRDTLYLRDRGQFSGFEMVANEGKKSTLEFNLNHFTKFKYKGEHSSGEWTDISKEDIKK